jgi:hypothetical protein
MCTAPTASTDMTRATRGTEDTTQVSKRVGLAVEGGSAARFPISVPPRANSGAVCDRRSELRHTLPHAARLLCAVQVCYQRYVHEFENGWLASSELYICDFHVCFAGHVHGPDCKHAHGHHQHQHGAGAGSPYGGRPTMSDVATAKGASMDR